MSRLGRGIEALIRNHPESVDNSTAITTVKIDCVEPNHYQPRRTFDPEKLNELAQSLTENGMIQPIIVTKSDNSKYELIAGERRLEAAKIAGFSEVPVIIRSVSKQEQLQLAIIENIQREDLNPVEEALAYKQLQEEFLMTHADISEIMGKDRATISNFLRLLKLPVSVQAMVTGNKLTAGHARAVLKANEDVQEAFAQKIIDERWSVREAEARAKKFGLDDTAKIITETQEPEHKQVFASWENTLSELFKVPVKISGSAKKGKVSFCYNSPQEAEAIISQLQKNLKSE